MAMRVRISTAALAAIEAAAAADPAREVCGLLLGHGDRIERAQPCANVAASPADRFQIDPAALIAAHRAARAGGPAIVGHYHSHPRGSNRPSARDAAQAAADGAVWLIVGAAGIAAWRAVADGSVAGRFEPVALEGNCAQATASPEQPPSQASSQ